MSLYLYGRVAAVGFGGIRFASNLQPDYTWPLQANNEDIFKNHFLWMTVRLYNCTQFWMLMDQSGCICFVCAWFVSLTLESLKKMLFLIKFALFLLLSSSSALLAVLTKWPRLIWRGRGRCWHWTIGAVHTCEILVEKYKLRSTS